MKLNEEQVLVSAHGINFEYVKSQWDNFTNISHFVLQSLHLTVHLTCVNYNFLTESCYLLLYWIYNKHIWH